MTNYYRVEKEECTWSYLNTTQIYLLRESWSYFWLWSGFGNKIEVSNPFWIFRFLISLLHNKAMLILFSTTFVNMHFKWYNGFFLMNNKRVHWGGRTYRITLQYHRISIDKFWHVWEYLWNPNIHNLGEWWTLNKELIVDFTNKAAMKHSPIYVSGAVVITHHHHG